MINLFKRIKSLPSDMRQVYEVSPFAFRALHNLVMRLLPLDIKTSLSIWYGTVKSLSSVGNYVKKGYAGISTLELSVKRTTDTVFILGSGPSINELKPEDWRIIKENDSWGFNFWFCHEHIPTAYFAQSAIRPPEEAGVVDDLDILMTQMLKDKSEAYRNVDFFLRGDGVNHGDFHNTELGGFLLKEHSNYYFVPELIVSSDTKVAPATLLKEMGKSGFFDAHRDLVPIPKFGSTVGELISLALILGYKNIVLCGIDMNDGGHFYDSQQYFDNYPFLKTLSEMNNSKAQHEHMNTSIRKYTIKDVVLDLDGFAKDRFAAKIWTSSSSSALYPEVEKFESFKKNTK